MKNAFLLCGLVALTACIDAPGNVDGRKEYLDKCAACHGTDAKGSGSFGRNLFVEPPDLTTLSQDNGGVFPRTEVMSIIDGLQRDPHFSGAMPEFGAGDLGELVIVEEDGIGTPVPEKLLALTDYLESIQN
ncbi:Cytochrome c, mono-and diheme variants [Cognatiyoonia koreensis]|uniref:Cytochrome c, mono-and diheme variants n=1 Tax=Cognatiyoonia koreensis TaxID=364200 RepID=A0A1I0QA33_9RHOB|nr:cytochrome c [Cognatiyoonia koreensis]SEW23740.1 Cytochrome c, mono-and diheme variants [Cognatiyoonia koreensis]